MAVGWTSSSRRFSARASGCPASTAAVVVPFALPGLDTLDERPCRRVLDVHLPQGRVVVRDDVAFVEGAPDSRSVTLFVRGVTAHVVDELERAIDDVVAAN